MSGPEFAKKTGSKYTTLAYWLQKRRRQRIKVTPASPPSPDTSIKVRWLEAVVDGPQQKMPTTLATALLVVHGPSGVRLEVSEDKQVEPRWLRSLLSGENAASYLLEIRLALRLHYTFHKVSPRCRRQLRRDFMRLKPILLCRIMDFVTG